MALAARKHIGARRGLTISDDAGFSLLEVLVALALTTMVITALMGLSSQQRETEQSVAERGEILFQATLLMNQWLATPEVTPTTHKEDVGDGRTWTVAITQSSKDRSRSNKVSAGRVARLLQVRVCCNWVRLGKKKQLCLRSERTAPPLVVSK